MKNYRIIMSRTGLAKAGAYLEEIRKGREPGAYLKEKLADTDIENLSDEDFLELLVRTKRPQIFAESAVAGDGSDWNLTELAILGDVNVAVPVTVYDNAEHSSHPRIHRMPFQGTLLYTPGALLRNDAGGPPADRGEVVRGGKIDMDGYFGLYERRLLPLLAYADRIAGEENRPAFLTVPGIGCGQFAGEFRGLLGEKLKGVLIRLLETHGTRFPHIKAVYYDPYSSGDNDRRRIGDIEFLVRPLTKGNTGKSQLCRPEEFEEAGDDFKDCRLFSFVAWDHVSWPGNDFWAGSRATADGVKAAATDTMTAMTGIKGIYDKTCARYDPPEDYRNWREVVKRNGIEIAVKKNLELFAP
jgi:hypothetical protein